MKRHAGHRNALTVACAALVTLMMFVVGGCGKEPTDVAPVEIDKAILAAPYDTITYPLDEYELTDDEFRTINHARAILVRRCLLRFGFDVPLPSEILGRPQTLIEDRHGLVDEKHAQEWGYRQKPPTSRAVPYEMAAPPEAAAVLYKDGSTDPSVPEGGCMGEAGQALKEGVAQEPQDVSRELQKEAWAKSAEDPRVKEKFPPWRACIKKTGYSFATPHDAVRHWNTENGAHGKPTPKEVTAALADVRCKHEVGLPSLWAAVEVAYQRALIEERSQQLEELKRWQEIWIRNATKIVAGREK